MSMIMMNSEYRNLPSVDKILSDRQIQKLAETHPRELLLNLVRHQLDEARLTIAAGNSSPSADEIVKSVSAHLHALENPGLRPVVNASGVILHTNLGRAPLSDEAIAAMDIAARGYTNLEYDLDSGTRGSRQVHVEQLLCQLTGAEAALVVNNNASAVLLTLTALSRRKEVVVSRGQAVEIGGSFRIPDVMRQSGAKLIEVGTTNCTYATDFKQAISPRTSALMRVHSSNFRLVGFVNEVSLKELVELGNRNNLPVFDDLGSGCFLDTTVFGLAPEPMVQESINIGAALALFSGDKLVGGPQSGIIVGKKHLVDKLKRHPLARAVRIDKTRLSGIAVTLIHYLKGEATTKVPAWRMISTPLSEISRRAEIWAKIIGSPARVIDGESMVGGGSLPGTTLPSKVVAIGEAGRKTSSQAQKLAIRLRSMDVPVIGRISDNMLLLDPRSVLPEEDETVLKTLRTLYAV